MKFYQITDLHYYAARELGACGDQWIQRALYDQKCMAESEAIVDATIDYLIADNEIDIVLISGDIVCDGERVGHYSLQQKLRRLSSAGKRVFVLTGTHDLHPEPKGYSDAGEYVTDGCTRDELIDIYGEFGYNDAIAQHRDTFSYVARLDDHTRLLVLNDDGIGFEDGFHGYFEPQLEWIKQQLQLGRDSGDTMLVMGHHPLLPPSPLYSYFYKDQMLGNWRDMADLFASYGVEFVFTGHTHMQNIGYYDAPCGRRIYDINTASLVGYPSPIRRMELSDSQLTVNTYHLDSIDYDLGGKSYMTYLRDHFDFMLRDIIDSAAHDIQHFCDISECFSLPKAKAERLAVPINIMGKFLDRLTFKKAGIMLCCLSGIAPRMYNVRLADFILELVCNVYGGDEPYAPGTAEYDSFFAIFNRVKPIMHLAFHGDEIDSVMHGVLYDDGYPDSDAVLPRAAL